MTDRLPATSCAYPWALIRRGGGAPGQRPFTRMAYLIETIALDGIIRHYVGMIGNAEMSTWTRTPRIIDPQSIVRSWRHQPNRAAINRAKQALKAA